MKKNILIVLLIFGYFSFFGQKKIDTVLENQNAISIYNSYLDIDSLLYRNNRDRIYIFNEKIKDKFIKYAENSFEEQDTLMFLKVSFLLAENNIITKYSNKIFSIFFNKKTKYTHQVSALEILKLQNLSNFQASKMINYCVNKKTNNTLCNSIKDIIDYNTLNSIQKSQLYSISFTHDYINTLNLTKNYTETKNIILDKKNKIQYFEYIYENKLLIKNLFKILNTEKSLDLKKRTFLILKKSIKSFSKEQKHKFLNIVLNNSAYNTNFIKIELDSTLINFYLTKLQKLDPRQQFKGSKLLVIQKLDKKTTQKVYDKFYYNLDLYSNSTSINLCRLLINNSKHLKNAQFLSVLSSLVIYSNRRYSKPNTKISKNKIDALIQVVDSSYNKYQQSIINILYYNSLNDRQLTRLYNKINLIESSSINDIYQIILNQQKKKIIPLDTFIDYTINREDFDIKYKKSSLNKNQINKILFADDFQNNKRKYCLVLKEQKLNSKQISNLINRIKVNKDYELAYFSFDIFINNTLSKNQLDYILDIYKPQGEVSKHKRFRNYNSYQFKFKPIDINKKYYSNFNGNYILPLLINNYLHTKQVNEFENRYSFARNRPYLKKLMYSYSIDNDSLISIVRLINPNVSVRKNAIKSLSTESKVRVLKVINHINLFYRVNKNYLSETSKVYLSNTIKNIIDSKNKYWKKEELISKYNLLKIGNNESILNNYKSLWERIINLGVWGSIIVFVPLIILYIIALTLIYFKEDTFELEKKILYILNFDISKLKPFSFLFYPILKTPIFINKILVKNKTNLMIDFDCEDKKRLNSFFNNKNITYKDTSRNVIDTLLNNNNNIKEILFIVGNSGSGKSTLINNYINNNPRTVLIKAKNLNTNILSSIFNKVEGVLKNEKYLNYILKKGKLKVIIDGLNELNTNNQDSLVLNIKDKKYHNIIISTQTVSLIKNVNNKIFIKGIIKEDMKLFLLGYEESTNYKTQLKKFIENIDDFENSREILSNPMDLSIIAFLLNKNIRINIFEIYNQYFNLIINDFNTNNPNRNFRADRINKIAYEIIKKNENEIVSTKILFELELLLDYKMVIKVVLEKESETVTEWFFRHDKITAYFASNHFIKNKELRIKHFENIQFKNTYLFVAEKLSIEELKKDIEELKDKAMESEIIDNTSLLAKIYKKRLNKEKPEGNV